MKMTDLLSRIKRKVSKLYRRQHAGTLTEVEFYKRLFIENKDWSRATPNVDENLRWGVIGKFLFYIEEYHRSFSGQTDRPKILDLGCGRGWLTNLLSGHG